MSNPTESASSQQHIAAADAVNSPVAVPERLRSPVAAFARLMEQELLANDHKGGWQNDNPRALAARVVEEAHELLDACSIRGVEKRRERVAEEAADVANMAMMVADVCGCLSHEPTPPASAHWISDPEVKEALRRTHEATREAKAASAPSPNAKFAIGQRVRKLKGSSWQGRVCGYYRTPLTPIGYAVESEREPGSVQIYPEAALEAVDPASAMPTAPGSRSWSECWFRSRKSTSSPQLSLPLAPRGLEGAEP